MEQASPSIKVMSPSSGAITAMACAAVDAGGRGATLPLFLRSLMVCTNALVRSLSSFATPWRQQPGAQRFFIAAMQEHRGRPAQRVGVWV